MQPPVVTGQVVLAFAPDRNTECNLYSSSIRNGTTITLTWNVPDPDGAGPCKQQLIK
jgi:hypothetical protein